jgi:hypothetical protein
MAKQVTDREHSAASVAAAAETHAERVSTAFSKRFGKYLRKKETMPDVGFALTLVARALHETTATLVDASQKHDAELADDAAPREARDAATAELIALIVGIRATVDNVYGTAGIKGLGLDGRTPTDAKAILEHARKLLGRLEDPKLKWPKPVQDGVKIHPDVWVNKLKAPAARLEAARKDVVREEREAQATGDAKAKALAAHDELFGTGSAFISAALSLVGEQELADRTRPSARRAGTTAAEEDGAEAGDETGADPPTGEALK